MKTLFIRHALLFAPIVMAAAAAVLIAIIGTSELHDAGAAVQASQTIVPF